jgi:hypothetical protein
VEIPSGEITYYPYLVKISSSTSCCARGAALLARPHVLVDFMVGGMSPAGPIRGNLECLRAGRRHLGAPLLDIALF